MNYSKVDLSDKDICSVFASFFVDFNLLSISKNLDTEHISAKKDLERESERYTQEFQRRFNVHITTEDFYLFRENMGEREILAVVGKILKQNHE